jgi:hypothetical protein
LLAFTRAASKARSASAALTPRNLAPSPARAESGVAA